jgi:hypothetical protein
MRSSLPSRYPERYPETLACKRYPLLPYGVTVTRSHPEGGHSPRPLPDESPPATPRPPARLATPRPPARLLGPV